MEKQHPIYDRIISDPAILDGQPCIQGTRLTVKRVLLIVSSLQTPEAIAEGYPQLSSEDIRQALAFAASQMDEIVVPLKHAS